MKKQLLFLILSSSLAVAMDNDRALDHEEAYHNKQRVKRLKSPLKGQVTRTQKFNNPKELLHSDSKNKR